MRVAPTILVLTLVAACSNPPAPKAAAPIDRASGELDILETVFRYQFGQLGADRQPPDAYFLSLSKAKDPPKDPPDALLARFRGHVPPVEPVSAADPKVWMGVHAKGKKGKGAILRLTKIRWIDDETVEVDGDYYRFSRYASGYAYRVERRQGNWVVVESKERWFS